MHSVPQKIRSLYMRFDMKSIKLLADVYSDDIQFKDPLHAINGLPALKDYYKGMMTDLLDCRFEFHHSIESTERGEAVLFWTMHYRHKKLAGGKQLRLNGNSHLLYKDKVYYHRDYFDAGAMIYEHISFLGFFIRKIKQRIGA